MNCISRRTLFYFLLFTSATRSFWKNLRQFEKNFLTLSTLNYYYLFITMINIVGYYLQPLIFQYRNFKNLLRNLINRCQQNLGKSLSAKT